MSPPPLADRSRPLVRPVPIRAKIRIRLGSSGTCRVTFQVSFNPTNGANLTDLTILAFVLLKVEAKVGSRS